MESEQTINKDILKEIETEYSKWSEFLNTGVGLLAFNLGISCIGTPYPLITALISIVFLILFVNYGQNHFPKRIRDLRKSELKGIDELLLIGIEKKYFGFKAMVVNFSVFTVGWLFLLGVATYGLLIIVYPLT